MGRNGKPVKFKDQDYEKLHKHHHNVLRTLYSDPLFPPTPSSIGTSEVENLKWVRPNEISQSPCLCADRIISKSVTAGRMSSNWIVSALSVLAAVGELYRKVIPDYRKQEWGSEEDGYTGIFHFRFWRFGQWMDVVIDDLLPTCDNELIFTHSSVENEFWVSLVEKAYAKLHGSYEALEDGHLADALVDFTGGVSETVDLKGNEYNEQEEKRIALFEKLIEEIRDHSVMCSIINISSPSQYGARNEVGLCQGYAYAITSVKKIKMGETSLRTMFQGRESFPMVRLRDPRGDGRMSIVTSTKSDTDEPNDYAYSTSQLTRLLSKNPQWSKIKDTQRERLGLTVDHSGEFWMPLEDFVSYFNELIICRLFNTNMFTISQTWSEVVIKGEWTEGAKGTSQDRSGGGPTFTDTYLRNPQYMFNIKKPEEEIVIQMLQESLPHETLGLQRHLIGFIVVKVEDNRQYRLHQQWDYLPTVIAVDHIRRRELYYHGYISKGRYILVPSTYKPGEIGKHMIRIFSDSDINLRVLSRDMPRRSFLSFFRKGPVWVTVINIKSGKNLKAGSAGCNPYCTIKCEGKKFKTPVMKNTSYPLWNSSFVFYRSSTSKPLTIKVYSHRTICKDIFLGEVGIPAPLNYEPSLLRADLTRRGKDNEETAEGSLELYVLTDDNLLVV